MAVKSAHVVAKLRFYEPHKERLESRAAAAGLSPSGYATAAVQAVLTGEPLALPASCLSLETIEANLLRVRLNLTRIANDLRANAPSAQTVLDLCVLIERLREEIAEACRMLAEHLAAMQSRALLLPMATP